MKLLSSIFLIVIALGNVEEAEVQFNKAMSAIASDDYQTALTHFESALKLDPNNIRYGNDYRQAVLKIKEYDRAIQFFEQLVTDNPNSANAYLNFGFAYVDKIPDAGSITQVINANTALSYFTKSLELQPSWIGYYTRGNSYLYWPKIFGRTQLGIDDLEKALEIQVSEAKRNIHLKTWISLGDGYWKNENPEKAIEIWKKGVTEFPESEELKKRLSSENEALAEIINKTYDPNRRVDTNLEALWTDQ